MKRALFLTAAALPTLTFASPADVLPAAFPALRYEKLALHSPFSPPSGPAVTVAPTPPPKAPGWADSLSIVAAMQDGQNYLVTLLDRDSNERFLVSSDGSVKNSRDVALTSVQWSELTNQTQATVRKGTEFATVKFDAAGAPAGGGNLQTPGAPPIPGAPPLPRPMFNPPPSNGGAPPMIPGLPNAGRRNQIIRATPPPPQRTIAPRPAQSQARPGLQLPAADDDDDD